MMQSENILDDYTPDFKFEEVESLAKKIIDDNKEICNDIEVLKKIFNCIDLTTLKETDSSNSVMAFIQKVNQFEKEYPNIPNVGGICVFPVFTPILKQYLKAEGVNRAVVSAGFPASQTFLDLKVLETKKAVDFGANEIDVVISVGEFIEGNYEFVYEEIRQLKEACGKAHLKVILETGAIKDPELIWNASIIAMDAGADFIKTSTGKIPVAATIKAAYVMCRAIKAFNAKHKRKVGFKPAGGIAETYEAVNYYAVVKDILGEEWLNKDLFRIGASRLANNLLSDILKLEGEDKGEVKFF
ncbi:deoxyribose-phosphate aldolase [Plebeiibacterium marinum]|uniref:Deoxyribose-phosphate aldolase n=1 Tax=Plebeiibacterium marinum TaxID=2992111 RepID=A0AAE3MHA5_9BACT|nr:deoxyribose-phosphate aldolase [Plebeiobacterium marinum]MCW3807591.1 deoxyribose-phosphate aldolase [Plebeiobacterium marinum]